MKGINSSMHFQARGIVDNTRGSSGIASQRPSVNGALESILNAMSPEDRPKDIIHDDDGGFKGAHKEFLEQRGISHRTKDKDQRQHTSVVDAAILNLKKHSRLVLHKGVRSNGSTG